MHKLWLGLLAGLLLAGGGFADTVFLKNGRSIKGKVIAENDDQVVVKTPGGRVPLPRKLIERIERTSAGQTALDMGRQRAREGDYERAREQFRLALDDPDPQVSSAARKELETLPAGSGPPRAAVEAPRPAKTFAHEGLHLCGAGCLAARQHAGRGGARRSCGRHA